MKNVLMSKITDRGQITLPKGIRDSRRFKSAHAVVFVETGDVIQIQPVIIKNNGTEQDMITNHLMKDWSDTAHDNLFDFS